MTWTDPIELKDIEETLDMEETLKEIYGKDYGDRDPARKRRIHQNHIYDEFEHGRQPIIEYLM